MIVHYKFHYPVPAAFQREVGAYTLFKKNGELDHVDITFTVS